jgi:hypothetical protein
MYFILAETNDYFLINAALQIAITFPLAHDISQLKDNAKLNFFVSFKLENSGSD